MDSKRMLKVVPKDPRPYAKISVDMPANLKLMGATPQAKWLAVTAILWCTQNITDGQLPAAVAVALAGVPARYETDLIERGIWHQAGHDCPDCPTPVAPGYVVIHHFLQHQGGSEAVAEARAVKSKGGRAGNHKRWGHQGPAERCKLCKSDVA